jgi:hypothetical protein
VSNASTNRLKDARTWLGVLIETKEFLIMRKLIAWVFMYSLDGLLADEGTEYWQFCFGLPVDPADLEQKIGVYQSAYAHIMGRAAYEGMAGALADGRPPVLRHHERRAQGRLLPETEDRPSGPTPPLPLVTRPTRSTRSGEAATTTSWSGAALASGGRSCGST